jgi:hypothetical protein
MKSLTPHSLKILTFVGLFFLLIPISLMGLWIYAFNLGTTQIERDEIYSRFFPGFLLSGYTLAYLSLVFCIIAIILSSMSLSLKGKLWKASNIIILVFSSLLLLLNLFQLM